MLGISFTLSSYITFDAMNLDINDDVQRNAYNRQHKRLLRIAILVWEIAAPITMLVAAVIRYVMWPAVLRRGGAHSLNSWRNIWMHNMNVLMAVLERCVLSGLPIRVTEWSMAPLYGCVYVVFSWNMIYAWNDRQHGPQFIYFFLDTTMPGYYCSKALLSLLFVLTTFYAIFTTTDALLFYVDVAATSITNTITGAIDDKNEYSHICGHLLFALFLCSLVMRFQD
jgi:hypothetical protein